MTEELNVINGETERENGIEEKMYVNTGVGDNREVATDGNEERYRSEEIEELFDIGWLIDKDNRKFGSAKQKVNNYVRRRRKNPVQATKHTGEDVAFGRDDGALALDKGLG